MGILSKEKKEKIQLAAHILAGFIILIHAYEKYDLHESSYIIFVVLGIIFLCIALLHHRLAKWSHFVDSIFLIIEAICLSVIAGDFFHEGKKALPYCYVFAALMYVVVAFIKYKQKRKAAVTASQKD